MARGDVPIADGPCPQLHHFAGMYQNLKAVEASKPEPAAAQSQAQVQASVRFPCAPVLSVHLCSAASLSLLTRTVHAEMQAECNLNANLMCKDLLLWLADDCRLCWLQLAALAAAFPGASGAAAPQAGGLDAATLAALSGLQPPPASGIGNGPPGNDAAMIVRSCLSYPRMYLTEDPPNWLRSMMSSAKTRDSPLANTLWILVAQALRQRMGEAGGAGPSTPHARPASGSAFRPAASRGNAEVQPCSFNRLLLGGHGTLPLK